ncbi:MAG TPA: ABC transporter substrate-binding protein [Tepidisphaeraceae bacterium]|nr:ABC transporter substrate-binding protein [Tepidisphaeraceae bacterium]
MMQRRVRAFGRPPALPVLVAAALLLAGCERAAPSPPATAPATQAAAQTTVASLSPAATDLLIGMGAVDRLVAVSHFEPSDRAETRSLPKVGDYQSVDWERLADLRPAVMVIQIHPDRVPRGLAERAAAMGLRLVNIRIDTLADIYPAMAALGDAIGEPRRASDAGAALRAKLGAVANRVAGRPRVRTLMVLDDAGQSVVAQNNFLDDLLTIAGGANAASGFDKPYVKIDPEGLATVRPDVVLLFRPAKTRVEAAAAAAQVAKQANVSADRVRPITLPNALLPGYNVGAVAEAMAELLHGAPGHR